MDYELKKGEKLNGGYSVTIGDYTLRLIGGYETEWKNVYDSENSFRNYDGTEVKPLIGRQFSLKLNTNSLSKAEFDLLQTELKKSSFAVECPDFNGECYCENIPGTLKQANFAGVKYGTSITLISKSIEKVSGDGL